MTKAWWFAGLGSPHVLASSEEMVATLIDGEEAWGLLQVPAHPRQVATPSEFQVAPSALLHRLGLALHDRHARLTREFIDHVVRPDAPAPAPAMTPAAIRFVDKLVFGGSWKVAGFVASATVKDEDWLITLTPEHWDGPIVLEPQ